MKKLTLITLAIVILLGVLLMQFRAPKITNINSSNETIVAFGDSLVVGVGSTENNDFVSLLSSRLDKEIINLGVSGDTTKKGLARVDEVTSLNPKVVILLLGGNDALQKVSLEETFSNLEQIIDNIHSSGSSVLLVGVQGGIFGDKYRKPFKDISKEKRTMLVPDILDGLIGDPSLMADPIHPNNDGYVIVADRIEPAIREILNH